MSLVPTTYRDLSRELDRPRYYPPYDFNLYPYLYDDPRVWWPSDILKPMDDLVTRRVRNQLIRSSPLDWSYPMRWQNYYAGERVYVDEKRFQVDIDVRQFKPHEIVVKTTDDYVIVQGNHEKRNDGNGLVERHFVRKYLLPRGFNANEVISDLSSDGILTIKVPPPPPTKYYSPNERLVRVHETGRLALPWK
ncbi:heat shock protein 27-like [Teleopsis dalmanni]|uniref:heat shock protein 27-like n=1 Tax=Teleopsis dalmanni TaxID=139649 RepID=UPI0018CD2E74|nr:heat shock protein 27-like [Teleopsis dalmanni]XP_037938171.1 heat shock protein 27-like [Teleopsis dalmanni]